MDKTTNTTEMLIKKSKTKFKTLAILLLVFWIVGIAGGFILNMVLQNRDYAQFKLAVKNNDLATMYNLSSNSLLFEKEDVVQWYEDALLGNTNHEILQGGLKLNKENMEWFASPEGIILSQDGSTQTIFEGEASYLNYYDGGLIFRDNYSKTIIHLKDNVVTNLLKETKVGELIVDYNSIYYINLSDKSYVYKYDIISKTNEAVVKSPTHSFILMGDKIIAHSIEKHILSAYNKNNGFRTDRLFNVDSYTFSDKKLYVSDSYQIISCTTNFNKEKSVTQEHGKLLSAFNSNLLLIDMFDQFVYINDAEKYVLADDVVHCYYAYFDGDIITAKVVKVNYDKEYRDEEITVSLGELIPIDR